MTDNLARHEVGDPRCFQHRYCTVTQTVEGNFARFMRLVATFAGAFMSAGPRLNKSWRNKNIPELIRQRGCALRPGCAREDEIVRVVARWQ